VFRHGPQRRPCQPGPLVELASLEIELEQYNKARLYLEQVEKMEQNPTTLEINPMSYTFRAHMLLAECYLNMGGAWIDKAEKYAKKALSYKKKDSKVKQYVSMIIQINKDRKYLQEVVAKYRDLRDEGKKEEAQKLLDDLPDNLSDNPVISQLRQADNPFKWPEKSIAIMTGDTALDEWGPWSLREGIGGSKKPLSALLRS
jgi:hypothetical protein